MSAARCRSCLNLFSKLSVARRRAFSGSPQDGLAVIYDKIKFAGPLTVADYMRECLLNPVFGYYMQGDVFGRKGDFITSPEISQVFGELLAVWVLSEWKTAGEPGQCQLVELGPGRGTLLKDMLRVFSHDRLQSILTSGLSLHLVEASPPLSTIQEHTLRGTELSGSAPLPDGGPQLSSSPYKRCTLEQHHGMEVSWYHHLDDVPQGHSYFIAHEFFDAIPIHQFQRTPSGWREILVDIDPLRKPDKALRFVLAPGETPASAAYSSLLPDGTSCEGGEVCEVCPEGLVMTQQLAARVREDGGAALMADYGEDETKKNTLRGFKNHQLHDVLTAPGTIDLTADVDFGALKRAAASEGACGHGPITQNEFLHRMGIRQRIEALMKGANPSQARNLVSSYEMLTSPEKMGHRFKFFSISTHPNHIPVPFFNDVKIMDE